MNSFFKSCVTILIILALTGCIAEDYDFTPPALKLSSSNNIESEKLAEATVNWMGEDDVQIEREVTNISTFAESQPVTHFNAGEKIDLLFEHGDFAQQALTVSVWKNNEKSDLEVNNISFVLPQNTGEYIIEVNLLTDRGSAQYVGNIVID